MMNAYKRRSAALLLLSGATTIPLAGCDMLASQTGISRPAAEGAVGGAAFGGVVAAIAGANPAWIAASVVLGGVTGGVIGDHLGKKDATTHAEHNLHALDTLAEGQTESWSDSASGNSGSTTVRQVNRNGDGSVCKTYTETIHAGTETVTRDATACKAYGGNWAVRGA